MLLLLTTLLLVFQDVGAKELVPGKCAQQIACILIIDWMSINVILFVFYFILILNEYMHACMFHIFDHYSSQRKKISRPMTSMKIP